MKWNDCIEFKRTHNNSNSNDNEEVSIAVEEDRLAHLDKFNVNFWSHNELEKLEAEAAIDCVEMCRIASCKSFFTGDEHG